MNPRLFLVIGDGISRVVRDLLPDGRSLRESAGFTGTSGEWHRHAGLCVALTGWVIRERSTGPEACEGSYIAGGDFWMLHAWIVPGWENRDGMFAPANPKLCPPKTDSLVNRCVGVENWVTDMSIKELPTTLVTPENVPAEDVLPYEDFEPFFVERWTAAGQL